MGWVLNMPVVEMSTGFLMGIIQRLFDMIFRHHMAMAVTIILTEESGDMVKLRFPGSQESQAIWFWMNQLAGFI